MNTIKIWILQKIANHKLHKADVDGFNNIIEEIRLINYPNWWFFNQESAWGFENFKDMGK